MRVLVLHSRYLSGAMSGENREVDDELRLLLEAGHDVRAWQPSVVPGTSGVRMAGDAVWSRSAMREVDRLVRGVKPDIVHVHSLYPRLSPAVLRAIPASVPIVMTLQNFRLMCLPGTYLRDGSVCEDCAGRLPWPGVVHACYRDSRAASATLALSLLVHRRLASFSRVERFLAVSRFMYEKHIEAGIDASRMRVKANFTWPTEPRRGIGGPLLFVGRITPEKGLETALRALPPDVQLVVLGDGPERTRMEQLADGRAVFHGQVDESEVGVHLGQARALVVPSRWYEGQPRVILEAFAAGVPVLASRIGGLPELVDEGVNGYLIDPDDTSGWRSAMESVAVDEQSRRLGTGALQAWNLRFTPAVALREIEECYGEAISSVGASWHPRGSKH